MKVVSLGAALVVIVLFSCISSGQDSILTFSTDPSPVVISPGGTAELRLAARNVSAYEADDLQVSVINSRGIAIDEPIGQISVLPPFGDTEIPIEIRAPSDLLTGEEQILFEAIYTYCIDVSCFQIIERVSVDVLISGEQSGSVIASSSSGGRGNLLWLIPALGAVLIVASIVLWRLRGFTLLTYLVLLAIAIGTIAYGVMIGQHEQARGIAAVLCTSCVGIEEARGEVAELSPSMLLALGRLESDVELLVFHALWCHSCAYAEVLVQRMAEESERVSFKLVDVQEEPDLASVYGVVRSNRTIVPAVVLVGTGQVFFGVENLEKGLLEALGGKG